MNRVPADMTGMSWIRSGFVLLLIVVWPTQTVMQSQDGRQRLDFADPTELRLASNGNVAVLVTQDRRSNVGVFRSVDGGPFVPTRFVVPTTPLERQISGLWATAHGFFIRQANGRSRVPRLLRSVDGDGWETVDSPAFAMPADIYGMTQLAGGDLLAIGVLVDDGSRFRGAMWRSPDGINWQLVLVEGSPREESSFGSIATLGRIVVVAGRRSDKPALWRSDDEGRSWVVVNDDARGLQQVLTAGGRFVRLKISVPFSEPFALTSATSPDGRTWREGKSSSPFDEGLWLRTRQVTTTTSGTFILGSADLNIAGRWDRCYAEPADCTRGTGSIILHTTTGDEWRTIDVVSLFGQGYGPFAVADSKAGIVIAGARPDRVEIITVQPGSWSYVSPPVRPALPAQPPLVAYGGSIDAGKMYRYPLGVHCGLTWLGEFNGQTWKVERRLIGAPDDAHTVDGLPQVQQRLLGTIRLTAPDTIEYAIEGIGVIAVYKPTTEPMPLCI